ncbi:MAG: hypothetical protein AAF702_15750 [Chloroflexota bacterium]
MTNLLKNLGLQQYINFFGGVLVIAGLIAALYWSPSLIKIVGVPLTVLPRIMGLMQGTSSSDITIIPLLNDGRELAFEVAAPGNYLFYSAHLNLLRRDVGKDSTSTSWMQIENVATGSQVPTLLLDRGIRVYDPPSVDGRPIIQFEVTDAGRYRATINPSSDAPSLTLIPNVVVGNETQLNTVIILQVVALIGIPLVVFYRKYRQERKILQAVRKAKREATDTFWQAEVVRQKKR